ncbi:TetR/AcrR family transcriptional regulator [Phyllobacterium myrsinacearum]|uniref:TetR family transcriptional regulator n=1 Tax=Phyllobacterium myrsinacearum TaxID=28101 RepID=A0A2S9JAX0_9HYPH|nr:TetR/AcrR family transcriptional regulator [Phyllobacterium myrsinacearum]PRD49914.1 TetR family transcriptional regulator [Phyllobacterium myrsinacearum]PWV86591.1 TetR family transcriptional regulator [Phyllobacterium myrsinacearum]RZU96943.1 TetR family transcriptional regulator [Phyllobacterium myrsinacearum]
MSSLKERITAAAYKLFDENGIQHVTMDAIAVEAKTTKMGIYRHFDSRDALIQDWLTATIDRYRHALDEIERVHHDDPRAQLMALAEFISRGLRTISHRGCPFVNTIAEIEDRESPLRQQIEAHKTAQAGRVLQMCRKAHIPNPQLTTAEITFLFEGAQVSAQNGSIQHIERHIMTIMRKILER